MPAPSDPAVTAGAVGTDPAGPTVGDPVSARIRSVAGGLGVLCAEAAAARTARRCGEGGRDSRERRDGTAGPGVGDQLDDVPTFYDWHNRPR